MQYMMVEVGLDYAMTEIYDVIILDIMSLPKLNGLELLKNYVQREYLLQ